MKTPLEPTTTTTAMEPDIFQPATQTGITRRTFLKRTVSTTLAVLLALNSFKAESYAQQGGNSGGQYGITITIVGDLHGNGTPSVTSGANPAAQGASIQQMLDGLPGMTVKPLTITYLVKFAYLLAGVFCVTLTLVHSKGAASSL